MLVPVRCGLERLTSAPRFSVLQTSEADRQMPLALAFPILILHSQSTGFNSVLHEGDTSCTLAFSWGYFLDCVVSGHWLCFADLGARERISTSVERNKKADRRQVRVSHV